jgi:hypothetical protein
MIMIDPFPALTAFLENVLLYLMFVGILLATISGIISGILFLPIFGLSELRRSMGTMALRATVVGLLIILLTIPVRDALIAHFPVPTNLPVMPLSSPTPFPSVGPQPTITPKGLQV